MADTSNSMDLKVQIAFRVFVVFSLIVIVANLHPQHSLGAAWFRSICSCFRSSFRPRINDHNDTRIKDILEKDEKNEVGMFRSTSIDVPSSRMSFDDTPLRTISAGTGSIHTLNS
ncbi:hypothetical protein BU25DRAFT_412327 [Macroventuria anomochaeta]|uniref:Uncharacterized protein n=1 Tax=Macroventuria anomochaeta TaxID=301207 RepID=A0ACB6RXQ6_9PLEO|nr:uncharacterized protein BU25DRAFT_412327 [Macroventuria anomochaeta]KAF2625672.1 hypothetical protein BU25DRAFT_412327 [Macroventuria anomochaeta]